MIKQPTAMVKLQCPAYTDACGYTTEELEFELAMQLIEMHIDIVHAAVDVNTTDEAVEAEDVNTIDETAEAEVVNTIYEAVETLVM